MTETAWQLEEVACGMCRKRSPQTVAPDLTSEGSHDLEGRPAEPLRSALAFKLGRCPHCGYVSAADTLWAPEHARERAAVKGLIESRAYRRLSQDATLPIVTRICLCRSLIDDVLGEPARALVGALFAAWACDDHGLDAAASELRSRAIECWDAASETDAPAYPDSPPGSRRRSAPRCCGAPAASPRASSRPPLHSPCPVSTTSSRRGRVHRRPRGARRPRAAHRGRGVRGAGGGADPRLISQAQAIDYRRTLIAGAIRGCSPHTPPGQPEDAVVFDGGGYYVQILVRPETLQVYAEAVDLDAQGMGRSPSPSANCSTAWDGLGRRRRRHGQLPPRVRGRDRSRARRRGRPELELTLRLVYGAGDTAALGLTVITYDAESRRKSHDHEVLHRRDPHQRGAGSLRQHGQLTDDTIGGFNTWLRSAKAAAKGKPDTFLTLHLFDDQHEYPYLDTPLSKVKPLTRDLLRARLHGAARRIRRGDLPRWTASSARTTARSFSSSPTATRTRAERSRTRN